MLISCSQASNPSISLGQSFGVEAVTAKFEGPTGSPASSAQQRMQQQVERQQQQIQQQQQQIQEQQQQIQQDKAWAAAAASPLAAPAVLPQTETRPSNQHTTAEAAAWQHEGSGLFGHPGDTQMHWQSSAAAAAAQAAHAAVVKNSEMHPQSSKILPHWQSSAASAAAQEAHAAVVKDSEMHRKKPETHDGDAQKAATQGTESTLNALAKEVKLQPVVAPGRGSPSMQTSWEAGQVYAHYA
jgi:hypothetical protein